MPAGARHGTAEPASDARLGQSRRRQRSRDRTPSITFRANPIGPMEGEVWLSALQIMHDRLDSLERYSRMHAASIVHTDEDNKLTRTAFRAMHEDFEQYKKFITQTHSVIDTHITNQLKTAQVQIDSMVQVAAPNIDILDGRVKTLEEALSRLNSQSSGPQDFLGGAPDTSTQPHLFPSSMPGMSTAQQPRTSATSPQPPQTEAESVPSYVRNDPWWAAAQSLLSRHINEPNAREQAPQTPRPQYVNIGSPANVPGPGPHVYGAAPPVPPSFGECNGPKVDSPFQQRAIPYADPQPGAPAYPGYSAWSGGKPSVFNVSQMVEAYLGDWSPGTCTTAASSLQAASRGTDWRCGGDHITSTKEEPTPSNMKEFSGSKSSPATRARISASSVTTWTTGLTFVLITATSWSIALGCSDLWP